MLGKIRGSGCCRPAGLAVLCFMILLLVRSTGAADLVARTTLKLDKFTCGACLRVIDAELRQLPGVLGMSAELPAQLVIVDHDPRLTPAEVAAKVTSAGYPAQVVKSVALPRAEARVFQREPGFGTGPGCCNPDGANPVADSWRELRRRFMCFRRRHGCGK